jgi:hypothetical protein
VLTEKSARDSAPAFVNRLRATAERAGEAAGWDERRLELAGRRLVLRFAGPALVDLMLPALAHLEAAPAAAAGDPDLTILLWDTRSTGVELPAVPWRHGDVGALGEVTGFNDEHLRVAVTPGMPVVNAIDLDVRTAVFWVRDPGELTWSERANPLRVILHWGLSAPGCRLAHAGAVGTGDGGALIAGPSGSGKSTVATACLDAGFDFAGDDHVLLTFGSSGAVARALYGTAKLHRDGPRRVPGVAPAIVNHSELGNTAVTRLLRPDEKLVADVHRWRPDRLRDVPIRAIVVPRIVARAESRLRPAGAGEALRALAPSTILQLPRVGPGAGLDELAEAVRHAPARVLELGTDTAAVPEVLSGLLEEMDTP